MVLLLLCCKDKLIVALPSRTGVPLLLAARTVSGY
jgi:hypothetical protein